MKASLAFSVLFFSCLARATIYVAAYDPQSKAFGLAYSSSGGHFWQTRVRGKGLIGAGGYGLCDQATPEAFLREGLSAKEVGQKLLDQCTAAGWDAFRLAIVTADGEVATVIASKGCTPENPECGERETNGFAVVGGGLQPGVLDAAKAGFEATDRSLPLACRLFQTLQAIYAAGGEKKDFIGASVTVDDPARPGLLHWKARGEKTSLLPSIKAEMTAGGLSCQQ